MCTGKETKKAAKNEVLLVNTGSLSTERRVSAVKVDLGNIDLTNLVGAEVGEKISLSRRVEKHWLLIGSDKKSNHQANRR